MRIMYWSSDVCSSDLIIPADTQLAPRPEGIPAWSSLSADERRLYARQMEVFAAQLSETDHEFGRILESLRRTGELDNTLVIVTSDNGASAEGGLGGLYSMMRGANGEPPTFEENFARIDRWGGPGVQGHYRSEEHTSELQSLMRISYAV